jgi:hypothetical protein
MIPQERQLVDDLFDRLSKVESAPRDPDAASAIAQGLRVAPNAVYALVQTVLVQDEALKRANSRIQELEAGSAPAQNQSGGFLDSMRDTILGQGQPHGSVPNVRPPEIPNRPTWNSGQVLQQAQGSGQYHQDQQEPYQQEQYRQEPYRQEQYRQDQYRQEPYGAPYGAPQAPMGGGGGSFLGTAAAAAAGAVGGSLLLGSIRSMMGGSHHSFGDTAGIGNKVVTQNPWSDQSGSGMARDAGINDIGSSAHRADDSSRSGLLDTASKDDTHDVDHDDMDLDSDDFGGDGDSDYA